MRTLFVALLVSFLVFSLSFDSEARRPVSVKGYFRKDGTYIAPHYRSAPDSSKWNNWSTKGNINPYTGKVGTKDPYGSYVVTPKATAPVSPLLQSEPSLPLEASRSEPQVSSVARA